MSESASGNAGSNTRHIENGITIALAEGGFWQYLANPVVEKIWCDFGAETQTVFFRDGRTVTVKTGCTVFNDQMGTPVSSDGTKMFVNVWEKGIFCYDLETMAVVWKLRKLHTMNIILFEDYITVDKEGYAVIKIDIETGKIMDEFNCRTLTHHTRVSENEVLAYYIKKTAGIIDTRDMRIVKLFEKSDIPKGIVKYIWKAAVRYEDEKLKLIPFDENGKTTGANTERSGKE